MYERSIFKHMECPVGCYSTSWDRFGFDASFLIRRLAFDISDYFSLRNINLYFGGTELCGTFRWIWYRVDYLANSSVVDRTVYQNPRQATL